MPNDSIVVGAVLKGGCSHAVRGRWDEPETAAYFSRLQNEAIQETVQKQSKRFVGFGSVPLQSIRDAIAIAEEAKKIGLKGLEIGTSVCDKQVR